MTHRGAAARAGAGRAGPVRAGAGRCGPGRVRARGADLGDGGHPAPPGVFLLRLRSTTPVGAASTLAGVRGGVSMTGARVTLVGREAVIGALDTALAECAEGGARIVLAEGATGCGKSALADAAAERARRAGALVLTAVASPEERHVALGVVRQLAHGEAGFALPVSAADGPGAPPARVEAMQGFCARLRELGTERPVVLVVDDVQHADGASLQYLQYLARHARTAAVLTVLTGTAHAEDLDPVFTTELMRQPHFTRLRLDRLTPTEVATALAALRPKDGVRPPGRPVPADEPARTATPVPNGRLTPPDGHLPADGPAPYGELTPTAGLTPNTGLTPNGEPVPSPGLTPNSGLTPTHGLTANGALTPSSGLASSAGLTPNGEPTTANGFAPDAALAPESGLTPTDKLIPNNGLTPNHRLSPNGELTPDSGVAPDSGLAAADGGAGGGGVLSVGELHRISGGNPLLLRALVEETGAGAGQAPAPAVGGPYAQAVATCLHRTGPTALAAARTAAVLGEQSTPERVVRLLGGSAAATRRALAALEAAGLVETAGRPDTPGRYETPGPYETAGRHDAPGLPEASPWPAASGEAGASGRAAAPGRADGGGRADGTRFRHPAARAAVLEDTGPATRADLHRRAARLLREDGAPATTVAGHLLAAAADHPATGPATTDPADVEVLREAAEELLVRGDARLATRLLELALRAGADAHTSHGIRLRLAQVAARFDPAAAERQLTALLEAHRSATPNTEHTRLLVALLYAQGRIGEAVGLDAAGAGGVAGGTAGRGGAAAFDTDLDTPAAVSERLLRGTRPADATVAPLAQAVRSLTASDQPDRAVSWSRKLLEEAERAGAPGWVSLFGTLHAEALLRLGDLTGAHAHATAALQALPDRTGSAFHCAPTAVLIRACSAMGRFTEASRLADRQLPPRLPASLHGPAYLRARGLHRLAVNQPHAALADFLETGRLLADWRIDRPAHLPWRTDAAEALLRLGEARQAEQLVLDQLAHPDARRPWVRGVSLRLRALTGEPRRRTALLGQAVEELHRSGDRVETARAMADLGRALQSEGSSKGNTMVRNAWNLAKDSEAVALCREILPDAPLTPPVRDRAQAGGRTAAGGARLSGSEQRVATLAAQGLTNREISAKLFLTVSTVEQHLTRVYRKLRISSRGDLPMDLTPVGRTAV
ncbi:BREX system ATP-binding domain-containing protein [Streptomyces sp. NPDC051704]|uniref:BREX system ATP-binding domain-containing protein n=1 Tax=Streptomyces sp. NPDC051704 TaxID=3365671 RepID=UPI0037B59ABF